MIHPIIDEFYSDNPSHSRSSKFAETKGQMSPTATRAAQEPTAHRKPTPNELKADVPQNKLHVASSTVERLEFDDTP